MGPREKITTIEHIANEKKRKGWWCIVIWTAALLALFSFSQIDDQHWNTTDQSNEPRESGIHTPDHLGSLPLDQQAREVSNIYRELAKVDADRRD